MTRTGLIRGTAEPATVSSVHPRSKASDELPRFYEGLEPTYEVALSSSAGHAIRREIGRECYLETAGWLFCDPRNASLVVCATGPGEDGVLKRSSVEIGAADMDVVREIAPHLVLCGDWHSHPSGDTLPSETDRRAWQRGCELTRSHWIGLVYAPAKDMWSQPQCTAFITVGVPGTMFCEPLHLREL
jgi:proteasome lid subunit RPN8/RPN11